MPCPTCHHTMQGLGKVESGDRYYWCPRCGTLRAVVPPIEGIGQADPVDDVPMLVERSRHMVSKLVSGHWNDIDRFAHRIGFNEACLLPEYRPNPEAP